jgi:aminoglycoside 6'-N-acetyltransferase I
MEIIKLESEDLLKKCSALSVEVYNNEPWNDKWTEKKALERLACFYNSPNFIGFVSIDRNEITGCILGNIEPFYSGDYFYLKEMFVKKSGQRKGTGTNLLNKLKETLNEKNINSVILFTSKYMFPLGFYQKNGFTIMEGMCMMDCKLII